MMDFGKLRTMILRSRRTGTSVLVSTYVEYYGHDSIRGSFGKVINSRDIDMSIRIGFEL